MSLDEMFPPERFAGLRALIKEYADRFGVHDFRQREHVPNTRRSLALAEVARDEGKLAEFRRCAMSAYWQEGMDLEDEADLAAIARAAGLSDDAVQRSKNDPKYDRRLDEIRAQAQAGGIEKIPSFVAGGKTLSGCPTFEQLESLVTHAGARKK